MYNGLRFQVTVDANTKVKKVKKADRSGGKCVRKVEDKKNKVHGVAKKKLHIVKSDEKEGLMIRGPRGSHKSSHADGPFTAAKTKNALQKQKSKTVLVGNYLIEQLEKLIADPSRCETMEKICERIAFLLIWISLPTQVDETRAEIVKVIKSTNSFFLSIFHFVVFS